MNIPDNLIVVGSFEDNRDKSNRKNKIINNYSLVYDKDDELKKEFYIMFCPDDITYFYFSVEYIETIFQKKWSLKNNYIASTVGEKKITNNGVIEKIPKSYNYIHELILENPDKTSYVINHINGNKFDNRVENLEYIKIEKKQIMTKSVKKNDYAELFAILNIDKFPKYVSYRIEIRNTKTGNYRDYFIIENHPKQNKEKWESSSSKKIDIKIRYQQTIEKLEELNNLV